MWLRICAEDPGIWLRLWAFGLYVQDSIANVGMRDGFGIVKLSGEKPGEKQKHHQANVREQEARRLESVFFPFS